MVMNMDISEIFKNYNKYIYNYALKLTCHPEDALDITQDTFVKAWEKLDTLENEKALAKWLRTICFHEFLTKARKEKERYIIDVDNWEELEQEGGMMINITPSPEDEIIVDEEIKSLQNGCFLAMVRKLSLNQRITFSLVDMFGLNIEYVADVLGISKGAAKGLLYRARMNIDSFFAGHCNIIDEKNPCSCKAWINFSSNRSSLQKKAQHIINKLDFVAKNYEYNEIVRKKILYLYSNMPEQKPSEEWYQKVLKILSTTI
jgi:RNA polymerase sigma-70 factor (ECF subfamily)